MELFSLSKQQSYFSSTKSHLPDEVHSSYMTVLFFIISGNDLLSQLSASEKSSLIDYIYSQQVSSFPNAGFRPNSSSILPQSSVWDYSTLASTYCALCALKILGDDFSRVNKSAILESLLPQITPEGSVLSHPGSVENDLRFVYCLCSICHLLSSWQGIPKDLIYRFILACQSYEGSFGISPGLEGHGGATYCALSSLYFLDRLDELPRRELLVQWLVMRQGQGFSGRIGKAPDTCYGYWLGMSMKILGCERFINKEDNLEFYRECQTEFGGFSKYPGIRKPDFTHSYLGLCALSLQGVDGLKEIFAPLGIAVEHIS
jgi:geranylgeranyl transferase type-1 subunit beta